jgi:hypothetical protein
MVAGFAVVLTLGLRVPLVRDFFQVGIPDAMQWALIGAIVAVGVAALLLVRRVPVLRRIEDPDAVDTAAGR